jgi:hypothetical protein
MTHELRVLERLRQGVTSLLHLPLSAVGLYAERETPSEQYALTLYEPYPIVEARLHRVGFVRNLALFVGPDGSTTDVYAHWEPSWIRHPVRHYRANDVDAATGVKRVRALFEREGIEYAVVPADKRVAPEIAPEKTPTR